MDGARAEEGGTIECAEALALVRKFVAGAEDVARRTELRAHLAGCVGCREQYRSEVVLVARLAHGGARELDTVRAMESRAGRIIAGGRLAAGGAARRFRLARVLLPVASLSALIAIAGHGRGGPARIESVAGTVDAAGTQLAPGDEPVELERGHVCTTGAGARARIEQGGTVLVLEPDTALLFERTTPLRVRLYGGSVLVDGAATIETAAGIVAAPDGAGVVSVDARRLAVVAGAGGWRFEGARESAVLAPGVLCERPLPLARAERRD
jgi:hypothetical protein